MSDPDRAAAVAAAAVGWVARLRGWPAVGDVVLDLTGADPAAYAALAAGRPTRLRRLYPDRAAHAEALRRAGRVRAAARQVAEEYGVRTGSVDPLERPVRVTARAAGEDDLELTVDPAAPGPPGGLAAAVACVLAELAGPPAELAGSDLVGALAGDPAARAAVAAAGGPPADPELVLDADADQAEVVAAAVAGRNVAVQAPPGTGATQTAANLVAALAAAGQRVLLVGHRPAALEAVGSRLGSVGLGGLLSGALRPAGRVPTAGPAAERAAAADQLAAHVAARHRPRPPWGVSEYAAQARLLELSPAAATPVRFGPAELAALSGPVVAEVRAGLREWAELGGATLTAADTPWYGALIGSAEQADAVLGAARRLATQTVPVARAAVQQVLQAAGLAPPATVAGWGVVLALLEGVAEAMQRLRPDVYAAPLPELVAATATRRWRREHGVPGGLLARIRLRRAARSLWRGDRPEWAALHAALATALEQRRAWQGAAEGSGSPREVSGLAAARAAYDELLAELSAFRAVLPGRDLSALAPAVLERTAARLAADGAAVRRIPRTDALARRFTGLGLGPLLADLTARRLPPDLVPGVFEHAWLASILAAEPSGGLSGEALRELAARFRALDRERLAAEAVRVRSAGGPVRCRAMPLLEVSRLPASRDYDAVVVLEAGRVSPALAVPALRRAHRAVLIGDDAQLPPAEGGPSVLGELGALLPAYQLCTHYRSRDERLVAFCNERFYGSALSTYPAVASGEALSFVRVTQGGSAEVQKVVGLVLDAAVRRPAETLGVVTLEPTHAERIEQALRRALIGRPELADVFGPDRFFVKDVARAQGEVRDAVIFSVGYGRTADGLPPHEFGRLDAEGAERLLNVALSRARSRLTVVASFSADELDPGRLRSAAAWLLRDFLAQVESGEPAPAGERGPADAVQAGLLAGLRAAGIPVVARYGRSGRPVELACGPGPDGRMVLAVETDGPAYAELRTARDRDRLRVEQLERLGWAHHRVSTGAWFSDPQREVAAVRTAYQQALHGNR